MHILYPRILHSSPEAHTKHKENVILLRLLLLPHRIVSLRLRRTEGLNPELSQTRPCQAMPCQFKANLSS